MEKIIIIKYGELNTKKGNRNYFINTLKKNIFSKLNGFSFDIIDDYYRMFIIPKNDDIEDIEKIGEWIKGTEKYYLYENARNFNAVR
mgnify:CR=1 FL=1